jgi:hypothetical protein
LRGDGCDQHCVASQAVRRSEKPPRIPGERPAIGGLLRFGNGSPGSGFGRFRHKNTVSLRRPFEIFPFLGDRDRRLGSICPAWQTWQCAFAPNASISGFSSGSAVFHFFTNVFLNDGKLLLSCHKSLSISRSRTKYDRFCWSQRCCGR